jgi:hypothetical protein
MKQTILLIFLNLALTINSQAQSVVFSNAPIVENEKTTQLIEFTLGEGELYQRSYFDGSVNTTYNCNTCLLNYFISLDGEVLGRIPTRFDGWNPKIAKKTKSYASSMILDPNKPLRSGSAPAQSLFDIITKGNLEPNKSYEIKVEVFLDQNREVISSGSFTLKTPNKTALEAFLTPYENQFLSPTWIEYDLPFKAGMTDSKIEKALLKVANANIKKMVYDVELKFSKAYIMATAEDWKGDDGSDVFPVVLFAKGNDGKCYRIETTYTAVMKGSKPSKTPVLKSKNAFEVPCVIANKYL